MAGRELRGKVEAILAVAPSISALSVYRYFQGRHSIGTTSSVRQHDVISTLIRRHQYIDTSSVHKHAFSKSAGRHTARGRS